MKIILTWKGKEQSLEVNEKTQANVLFSEAAKLSKLNPNRIRIVYEMNQKRIPIQPSQIISQLPSTKFVIRDLGPQFSYRGVFILEYLGPLLIWPLLKLFIKPEPNRYLTFASMMWTLHYVKRIFETIVIHKFSHPTMPLFNLFKNCTYYWGFALLISYFVEKNSAHFNELSQVQNYIVPFFFLFEGLNFYCHCKLSLLRPNGSLGHFLPRGFLFDSIACPNYTMEILSWICFAIYVQVWPAYLFPIFGTAQMFVWADKKRKNLISEFPEAKNRGRITPFVFL